MATCKECIHYDICIFHIKDNENEKCPHFKIAADVVPVVRCKDCDHLEKYGFCFKNINGLSGYKKPKADDFCSFGERK